MICKGCGKEIPDQTSVDPQHPIFEKKNHSVGCEELHRLWNTPKEFPRDWARGPYRRRDGMLVRGKI